MIYSLNMPIIKILIHKDWYLLRKIIAIYVVGALFALSFISLGEWQFFMGTTLLISMLIGLGNHQINNTIINERKEHTLPFVMSLPITPIDYVVAKLIANMSLFVIPWFIISAMTIAVFWFTAVPNGVVPLSVILGLYFLLCYCVTWAAGMISESEGVVLFVMIFMNCMIGPIIYTVTRFKEISQYIFGDTPVWSIQAVSIIIFQLLVILLAVTCAFYSQARKKTFL